MEIWRSVNDQINKLRASEISSKLAKIAIFELKKTLGWSLNCIILENIVIEPWPQAQAMLEIGHKLDLSRA